MYMDRKDFGYNLKNEVDKLLDSCNITAKTKLKEVDKDNGLKYNAILVGEDVSDAYIGVSIYYDKYYDMYIEGDISLWEAAQEVCRIYEMNIDKMTDVNKDVLSILDWEYVKDRISFVILNKELNRQYLEDIPNRFPEGMDDLCLIYNINLSGDMSLKVNNNLLDKWNISAMELHEAAKKSTEKIMQPTVREIQEVLKEQLGELGEEMYRIMSELDNSITNVKLETYVITSKNNMNGAGAILLESVQEKLKELSHGREFFIVPSSKHEMLAIPDNGIIKVDEIKDMVQEVNFTEVRDKDILSNNVYKYNPVSKEIKTLTNEPIIGERQHRMSR